MRLPRCGARGSRAGARETRRPDRTGADRRRLARTTGGASRKVRRIVNRARKRKPTEWHGAGSGGF
ncbi:hypothetical protein CRM91_30280 [Burkholderia ambifaria]|nr:hypothetical protein CRM91_30280 [Burkholderia ambifaria]